MAELIIAREYTTNGYWPAPKGIAILFRSPVKSFTDHCKAMNIKIEEVPLPFQYRKFERQGGKASDIFFKEIRLLRSRPLQSWWGYDRARTAL